MSRRGPRARGVVDCLARIKAIDKLHSEGRGTFEIQSCLQIRREFVSVVRGLLTAAEARGYAKGVQAVASPQGSPEAFRIYLGELRDRVLAPVVRAREAIVDGDLALAAAGLESAEVELVAIINAVAANAVVRSER